MKSQIHFDPPENDNFERVSRSIEVLYHGAKVLGTDMMLKWELAQNMSRPYADTTKVEMNYAICAPRMYKGRIESLVSKCIGFCRYDTAYTFKTTTGVITHGTRWCIFRYGRLS